MLAARRLQSQRLTGEPCGTVAQAVEGLVAVQAQDFGGAKWALGMRTRGATDALVDRLFDDGTVLRTHVLRPTWHFVLPDDIRWLLELTAPRVKALLAHYDQRLGIDTATLKRSTAAIANALRSGSHLTRSQLAVALERSGITARGQRLGHLVMHAELDAVVTSGPRRGKQFTYALLEERAPNARRLGRDEALGELTRRYFTGHGPAQAQDFAWWSGLTVADTRRGLEIVGAGLEHERIAGKSYWSLPNRDAAGRGPVTVHLLPNYDELVIAYRDRTAAIDPGLHLDTAPFPIGNTAAHFVVRNGRVCGGWKRSHRGPGVTLELGSLPQFESDDRRALDQAVQALAAFVGVPVSFLPGS